MPNRRFEHGAISRRSFLALSAGVVVAACDRSGRSSSKAPRGTTTSLPPVPALPSDPFTMGVASGDPAPDGFVLWTRLAPEPFEGGGMPAVDVPVRWMVARDESMRHVVAEGTYVTGPDVAHAVHVVVDGLQHDRPYWYRFAVGEWETPIARTRTFPRRNQNAKRLRFGFGSCQSFRDGYYGAWRDLAADEDIDLVVFLGDYIYESGLQGAVRSHLVPEVITLEQYRNQYALYRSDADLRAAHAAAPWLVTWDDHEVENNYQGVSPEAGSTTPDPDQFLARRAAAYRAWWEHMPTRLAPPSGPDLRIHRSVDFGRLARFAVLDTRQYRTNQPCSPVDIGTLCPGALDPATTLIGDEQQSWLADTLRDSGARWNVLAQQIVFSRLAFTPPPNPIFNLDQWDGYPRSRDAVLALLAEGRVRNPVVITGDIHASGVSDVKANFDDPDSPVIGTELVGNSITSGASSALAAVLPSALANNPHVKWGDVSKRGWVRCEVTPEAWRADFRFVDDVRVQGSPVTTAKSWVIEDGRPVVEV